MIDLDARCGIRVELQDGDVEDRRTIRAPLGALSDLDADIESIRQTLQEPDDQWLESHSGARGVKCHGVIRTIGEPERRRDEIRIGQHDPSMHGTEVLEET